jgi:hypothetical protein
MMPDKAGRVEPLAIAFSFTCRAARTYAKQGATNTAPDTFFEKVYEFNVLLKRFTLVPSVMLLIAARVSGY